MVDLNSLKVFAEIVEAGSFSEAARRLKMPLSTVSRRLSELEDQLNLRLLERSTRKLRLTDVGSVLQESRDLLKIARRHSGRGKHQVLERPPTAGRLVRLNCPVRHLCQRTRN
jgi:DNA-binding transcriptional LysR family regulator